MPSIKNPKANLRLHYYRTLKLSLILSLVTIIAAFKFSPQVAKIESVKTDPQEIIKIEDIINTVQKPDIPPPPKAPQIIEATVDNPVDDFTPQPIDDYKPVDLPTNLPPKPKVDFSDEEFIPVPEELPSPVGGLIVLQEKVHYTEIAKRIGLEGTVYIQAKINKTGDVVEATVLKALGAGLDEEALNAVKSTKFIPGKQRGKAVNVKMVIPIKFVLK